MLGRHSRPDGMRGCSDILIFLPQQEAMRLGIWHLDRSRVLVIEDDAVFRGMVVEFLRRAGFHADPVAGREQALDLAGGNAYEAALIDLGLKRDHGVEVAHELLDRIPSLGLVFVSGDMEGFMRGRTFPPGSYSLEKPLNLQKLQEAIEKAIGSSHSRSATR